METTRVVSRCWEYTYEDACFPRNSSVFSLRLEDPARKRRRADENKEGKRNGEGKADLTKCQAGKNSQRYYPRHDAKFPRQ